MIHIWILWHYGEISRCSSDALEAQYRMRKVDASYGYLTSEQKLILLEFLTSKESKQSIQGNCETKSQEDLVIDQALLQQVRVVCAKQKLKWQTKMRGKRFQIGLCEETAPSYALVKRLVLLEQEKSFVIYFPS